MLQVGIIEFKSTFISHFYVGFMQALCRIHVGFM